MGANNSGMGGGQDSSGPDGGPGGGGKSGVGGRNEGGGDLPKVIKLQPVKKTKTIWKPPQFIEGIDHVVEGFGDISKLVQTGGSNKERNKFNKSQSAAYDEAIEGFKRRQKLRLSIPSLPDSEALNVESQKKAARDRMRGRSGTMLSERETLG